jgi:hypothetical protein
MIAHLATFLFDVVFSFLASATGRAVVQGRVRGDHQSRNDLPGSVPLSIRRLGTWPWGGTGVGGLGRRHSAGELPVILPGTRPSCQMTLNERPDSRDSLGAVLTIFIAAAGEAASDVAPAPVWLVSDAATFVTGAVGNGHGEAAVVPVSVPSRGVPPAALSPGPNPVPPLPPAAPGRGCGTRR